MKRHIVFAKLEGRRAHRASQISLRPRQIKVILRRAIAPIADSQGSILGGATEEPEIAATTKDISDEKGQALFQIRFRHDRRVVLPSVVRRVNPGRNIRRRITVELLRVVEMMRRSNVGIVLSKGAASE